MNSSLMGSSLMGTGLLLFALRLLVATSAAVGVCALLRKPLRRLSGARAAYWIWLLVPVSVLAVLVPVPAPSLRVFTQVLPVAVRLSGFVAQAQQGVTPVRSGLAWCAFALWPLGALLATLLIVRAQWRFRRGLEPLRKGPGDALQSDAIAGPMLVGTWRPRVVLPADFNARYSAVERELVLAHEYAHLRRHDPLMNACAAATLCMNWYNPLLYWALGRFRFDQELACDAQVLAQTGARRRCYADALLKTHLAGDSRGESNWLIPVGCPWQPTHPLTERIAMLKLPMPGTLRRRAGASLLIIVIGSAGYACWAAQSTLAATLAPARPIHTAAVAGPPIALHMKWSINDADTAPAKASEITRSRTVLVYNVVAPAGNEITLSNPEQTFEARCTPSLPGASGRDSGTILVKCTLSSHGRVLGTPSLLVADGSTAAIEVGDAGRRHLSRLEINASTKPRSIAAVSEDETGEAADADVQVDSDDVDVPDMDDAQVAPEPPEPPEAPEPAVAPVPPGRPI